MSVLSLVYLGNTFGCDNARRVTTICATLVAPTWDHNSHILCIIRYDHPQPSPSTTLLPHHSALSPLLSPFESMKIQRCRRYFVRVQICLYRLWCPHRSCQDAVPPACNPLTDKRGPRGSTNSTLPQESERRGICQEVDNINTAAMENAEPFDLPFAVSDLPDCTCHGPGGARSYRSLMSSQSSLLPNEDQDARSDCASDTTCEDMENDNMPTSNDAAQIRAFIDLLDAERRTLDAPLQPGYHMLRIPRMRSFPPGVSADYARTLGINSEGEAREAGYDAGGRGEEWDRFRNSPTAAGLRSTNKSPRSGYPPSDGTDDRARIDAISQGVAEQPQQNVGFTNEECPKSTIAHTDGRLWSSHRPTRGSFRPSLCHDERVTPESNIPAVAEERVTDECDTSREETGSCSVDGSMISQNMRASV
jgi:hypothetical protein